MTLEELENFEWAETMTVAAENANEMAAYLSAIQAGELNPNLSGLTPEKAKELKMRGFAQACENRCDSIPFEFDGTEDFTGLVLTGAENLGTKYTGITGAQVAQCSQVLDYDLKNIKWSGNEDLSGVSFENVTGLQVPARAAGTSNWMDCTLGLVFSGGEDFSKAKFDGCRISGSTGSNPVKFGGFWSNSNVDITLNGTEDFSNAYFNGCSLDCPGITDAQRQQISERSDCTTFKL